MHVVLRLNTCKFKIKFWVVWFHTTSQSHAPGRPIRSEHTEPSLSPGAQAQLWVSGCGLAGGTWPIHSQGGKLAKSFISWPKWTGAPGPWEWGKYQPPHCAGLGPSPFPLENCWICHHWEEECTFAYPGPSQTFTSMIQNPRSRAWHLEKVSSRLAREDRLVQCEVLLEGWLDQWLMWEDRLVRWCPLFFKKLFF